MDEELYQEELLQHYKHPLNYGELREPSVKVEESNPLCGDKLILYLEIKGRRIRDVKFMGEGCVISIATASKLFNKIKNKSLEEIKSIDEEDIKKLVRIPLGMNRMKCALLSLKTLRKALNKYEKKEKL